MDHFRLVFRHFIHVWYTLKATCHLVKFTGSCRSLNRYLCVHTLSHHKWDKTI